MTTIHDHDAPPRAPDENPSLALELRVLTGLQAGAALPLDQPLTVGRSDDCDILLLDESVPEHLLRIEVRPDGRVVLEPLQETLTGEDGQPLLTPTEIVAGQAFGAAGVWLEVRPAQSPWTAWTDPADRVPVAEPPHGGEGPERPAQDLLDEDEPGFDFDDWVTPPMEAGAGSTLGDPWTAVPPDRDRAPGATTDTRRPAAGAPRGLPRWIVLGGGAVLTLSGLISMAVQLGLPAMADAMADSPAAPAGAHAPPSDAGVPPAWPAASAPSPTLAPPALPGTDGESPGDGGTTVLRGSTAVTLPFEVREVVMGTRSRVVLSDGHVLVPGEAVAGWRLMEIRAGTLVFEGPERVLLPW